MKLNHFKWKRWHYKNTTLLVLSLVVFFFLVKTPQVDNLIRQVGTLGYVGAFIAGTFFVSTFTVAPAAVILYHLADSLHPLEIAILAGLGAMVGDYIIFKYLKDKIFVELRPSFMKHGRPYIRILYRSPYFAWMLPVFGAFIIASPFPDEVGVGILGLSKIRRWQFFLLSLVLNATGIFLVVSFARLV
ncbi:hypothetical protein HYW35_02865 [Candidatus Saccharibacteria bacterium]|nr:hypothetical protein [Candidatus Saccharibacteria bacterium]